MESLRKVVVAIVLPRRADGGPLATDLNLAAAELSVFSFLVEALPLTETRAETAGRSPDGLRNINEIHTAI